MFVDLRLYLRSRDALVELFRVAERRQADVVTAQVCFFLVEIMFQFVSNTINLFV